jgi:hypothetical protein
MGKDLRLAAIMRFVQGLDHTEDSSRRFQAWPKAMPKGAEDDEDGDDEDSDDDSTDEDADDESDEDQEDSEDDDDADDDDADDDDDEGEDKKSKKPARRRGFKAPKSQADLDDLIAERLARKEREVRRAIKAEQDLQIAKDKGDSDTVIKNLEQQIRDLKSENKGARLESVKARVAEKLGLPASAARRLQGENEAEIRNDAKALKKELGLTTKPRRPATDDRGESNKDRDKKAGKDTDESWKKPEFWTSTDSI